MRVGVIGLGVVGSAVKKNLEKHFEVVGYDKKVESDPFDGLLEAEAIFVCVPTPTQMGKRSLVGWGSGQSLQAINSVFNDLRTKGYKGVVCVKSTILPGTTLTLQKNNPDMKVVANPEFLSAKTAENDFGDLKSVIIGTEDEEAARLVCSIYQKVGALHAYVVKPTEAESIKYIHNVFLAIKVAAMNELFDVCNERKTNYQLCADLACKVTGWINERHVEVPGTDGFFGFGGECFPKDLSALLCKYSHLDLPVMKGAIYSNESRRKSASKHVKPNRKDYRYVMLNKLGSFQRPVRTIEDAKKEKPRRRRQG